MYIYIYIYIYIDLAKALASKVYRDKVSHSML